MTSYGDQSLSCMREKQRRFFVLAVVHGLLNIPRYVFGVHELRPLQPAQALTTKTFVRDLVSNNLKPLARGYFTVN